MKEKKIDPKILPVYYIIGECYIKMNKIQKAKDYLIAAYWNSLKTNINQNKENNQNVFEEPREIAILRHRSFSLLFQKENNFEKAIDELISAILQSSTLYGVDSMQVVDLEFLLGILHYSHTNSQSQHSSMMCYNKYVNFWFYQFFEVLEKSQKMDLEDFLEYPEVMIITAMTNLVKLKEILPQFDNDQSITMIKLLFNLLVLSFILSKTKDIKKYYAYLKKYFKAFKDLPLVKSLISFQLDSYYK